MSTNTHPLLPCGISTPVKFPPCISCAAVNTCVANALGAGDGRGAASIFQKGLLTAVGLQAILATTLLMGGPQLVCALCQGGWGR